MTRTTAGSATVAGLEPETTYYLRVKATASRFNDSPWTAITAETLPASGEQLETPTFALSGTRTAIVVKLYPVDGAEKYLVDYSTDPGFSTFGTKSYTSTSTVKTIASLTSETWYYVRVRTTASGRPDSDYSPIQKIYTGSNLSMPVVTYSAVKTAVVLNVRSVEKGEKYLVEYGESEDFSDAKTKTYSSAGVKTISGLTFGTKYYFRVKATSSVANDSSWNDNNKTPVAAGQLATPSFFVSKVGSDYVNVRCYNSANASGFEVMCSTNSDFSDAFYAQGSGVVTVSGLRPNTKYYFKTRALGDDVSRVNSNWTKIVANATTLDGVSALDAPNVSVSATRTAIVVKINPVEGAIKYVIEYDTDPSFSNPSSRSFTSAGAKTFSGLATGTTYYFRIKSIGDGVVTIPESPWNAFQARTMGMAIPKVSTPSTTKVAITFRIYEVPDATSYVVEYGTSPSFDGALTKSYPTPGAKTISGLSSGTAYYLRIKAVSSEYGDSDWVSLSATTKTGSAQNGNSAFEDYFEDDLEKFWDVLADSIAK